MTRDVPAPASITWPTSAGCHWSEVNWSCAYNSALMSLYEIYASVTAGFQLRQNFSSSSLTANMLGHFFEILMESPSCTTAMFNHHRDKICDELSSKYPD